MGKKRMDENDLMLKLSLPEDMELSSDEVEVDVVDEDGEGEEMDHEDEEEMEDVEDLGEPEMGDEEEEQLPEMEMYEMEDDEEKEDDEVYESKQDDGIDSLFESLDDDDVIEIDENMLRKELARLSEAGGATDPKVLDDFGGAEVDKEPFVDADDEDLNEEEERKGVQSENRRQKENEKNKRAFASLKKENAEYKGMVHKLRKQLTETNLFNAKLLYTNKLLQNKGISPQQKISIVEALDKAETLREVKLLYKSLTKSLGNSLGDNKKLAESRKKFIPSKGSSSKPVKSSNSKKLFEESDQTKRWATLAGIMNE